MCKTLGMKTTKCGTHMPKPVREFENVTMLWNQEVHTDREVMENRPDMIIKNRSYLTCSNSRGQKYHAKGSRKKKKELKCKMLRTEIQQMWNVKCTRIIMPVVI
jgi:hypothetical protein